MWWGSVDYNYATRALNWLSVRHAHFPTTIVDPKHLALQKSKYFQMHITEIHYYMLSNNFLRNVLNFKCPKTMLPIWAVYITIFSCKIWDLYLIYSHQQINHNWILCLFKMFKLFVSYFQIAQTLGFILINDRSYN